MTETTTEALPTDELDQAEHEGGDQTSDVTAIGLITIAAALLRGVTAEVLVRPLPVGVNAPLFVLIALGVIGLVAHRADATLPVALDAQYLQHLSADSVPALVSLLGTLPAEARPVIAARLLSNWGPSKEDWRTWNLSRVQARGAIEANRDCLAAAVRS